MIAPRPNCFSIWPIASSIAFSRSSFLFPFLLPLFPLICALLTVRLICTSIGGMVTPLDAPDNREMALNQNKSSPTLWISSSELAAWKMMTRRSEAIIGEKSNTPMRGMNWRIGARIGSVMS